MPDQSDDGLGQGWLEELVWHWRFLRHRWTYIPWRQATPEEERRFATEPPICRFGEFTIAVADFDGKQWIIRERFWSGWPDAPTYALFVLENTSIWMARDFNYWPRAWRNPVPVDASDA